MRTILLLAYATCCAALQTSLSPTAAAARVRAWLEASPDASMLPPAALAPDVRFSADIEGSRLSGAAAYEEAARQWHEDVCRELGGFQTTVLRCEPLSTVSDGFVVAVRWRAQWQGDTQRPLRAFARLAGWTIDEYDLDAGRISTFSWRAVGSLLWSAARTGVLRLPAAAVEGRSTLRLDPQSGAVVSHEEAIDAVLAADGNRLLNRKIAQDAATWLDFRRPPAASSDAWAANVAARVLSGVPGAGVLDVDPNEEGGAVLVFALIAAVGLSFSVSSIGDATGVFGQSMGVFGQSLCDEVGPSDWGFNQCVSDMYT